MRLNTPMAISSQHPVASLSAQGHQVLPIIEGGGTSGETSFTLQPCFTHISSPISFTPNWPPSLLSNFLCSPTLLCSHLISHLLCSSPTSFAPLWPPLLSNLTLLLSHLPSPSLISNLLCSSLTSFAPWLLSDLLCSPLTSFTLQPPLLPNLTSLPSHLPSPSLNSDLLHSFTPFQPHFTPISSPISFFPLQPPSLHVLHFNSKS